MGGNKRRAPNLHSRKAAKRRATVQTTAAAKTSSCISSGEPIASVLERDNQQFASYLRDKPIAQQQAFSPELIKVGRRASFKESLRIQERSVTADELDETIEDQKGDDNDEAEHVKELEELKTSDPTFYQFLLENDRELLSFGQEGKGEDPEELHNEQQTRDEERLPGTKLTPERFRLIKKSALEKNTRRGWSLLLAAYGGVIGSLAKIDVVNTAQNGHGLKNTTTNVKREGCKKENEIKGVAESKRLFFRLDVEGSEVEASEIFFEVVSTVVKEIGALLSHIPIDENKEKANNNDVVASLNYPQPYRLEKRFQILVNRFWVDTILLLEYFHGNLVSQTLSPLKHTVLLNLASPLLLRWLVCLPERTRRKLILSLTSLWLEACKCEPKKTMTGSVHAFLVLQRLAGVLGDSKFHASVARLNQKKNKDATKISQSQIDDFAQDAQQSLISECYRAFIHLVSKLGYSWRTAAGYQFILNCLVELLASVHTSVAYRVVFLCTRQLSLVTRNANVARSQNGIKKVSAITKNKTKRLEEFERQVFSWSFVFSARFLVQAIGKIGRHLNPLAFPLSSILNAAVRAELSALNRLPFVLHCLQLQCDLMNFVECWIPLGSHLLTLGTSLIAYQEKVGRLLPLAVENDFKPNRQKDHLRSGVANVGNLRQQSNMQPSGIAAKSNVQKAPDLDVVIRLSDKQLEVPQVADQLALRWIDILVSYLGLLSRHPSFPETCIPVLFHLKKHAKCRNEVTRKELKQLLSHCELSITEVKQKRFNLDPVTDVQEGKLLVFNEKDISLARYRNGRLSQRLELFTLKMNAEAASEEQADEMLDESVMVHGSSEGDEHAMPMATSSHSDDTGDRIGIFALDTDSEDDYDD